MITTQHARRFGVEPAAIFERARRQTPTKIPTWQARKSPFGTYYAAEDGEGFAATAIATPEALSRLPIPEGRRWLAAPERDLAIAFEAEGPSPLLEIMALMVLHYYGTRPHRVSPRLYGPNGRVVDAIRLVQAEARKRGAPSES
jgi:hypothetical protein